MHHFWRGNKQCDIVRMFFNLSEQLIFKFISQCELLVGYERYQFINSAHLICTSTLVMCHMYFCCAFYDKTTSQGINHAPRK